MRRWGMLVAAVAVAFSTSGCWLQVGANPQRTAFNTETGFTSATAASLHQAWIKSVGTAANAPIVDGGRVFVSAGSTMNAFAGLDGTPLWSTTVQEQGLSADIGDAAVVNGQVFAPFFVADVGGTLSFDETTGTYTGSGVNRSAPFGAPAVSGSLVAVDYGEANLAGALATISYGDKTGFIDFGSLGSVGPVSNPMIDGRAVFVSDGTKVMAFSLDTCVAAPIAGDCMPAWSTDLGSGAGMPVGISATQIAVPLANGNIAVVDAATGTRQWTAVTGSTNAQATASDGAWMYVGTADGKLRAFPDAGCAQATCNATWTSKAVGGAITAQPAIGGDVVYVGTAAGKLAAFATAGCTSACAPIYTTTVDATATRVTPIEWAGSVYVTTDTGKVAAYR